MPQMASRFKLMARAMEPPSYTSRLCAFAAAMKLA